MNSIKRFFSFLNPFGKSKKRRTRQNVKTMRNRNSRRVRKMRGG